MELTKSLLLVKMETTYGVLSAPSESANAILVNGEPTIEIMTDLHERELPRTTFGAMVSDVLLKAAKLSFQVEFKGVGGNPATPPPIGPLLKICNMSETAAGEEGSESWTYACLSSLETPSASIYFWKGGTRYVMLGCVADLKSLSLTAGKVMLADFEVTGLMLANPTDVSFPTATYNSNLPQRWASGAFKLNAITTLVTSKFNIMLGNEIAERPSGSAVNGLDRFFVKDRKTKVEFDAEKVALSTFDPITYHTAQTLCDLETKVNVGTGGDKININVNDVTLDMPKSSTRDNYLVWDLSGQCRVTPGAGNGELTIVFK